MRFCDIKKGQLLKSKINLILFNETPFKEKIINKNSKCLAISNILEPAKNIDLCHQIKFFIFEQNVVGFFRWEKNHDVSNCFFGLNLKKEIFK